MENSTYPQPKAVGLEMDSFSAGHDYFDWMVLI